MRVRAPHESRSMGTGAAMGGAGPRPCAAAGPAPKASRGREQLRRRESVHRVSRRGPDRGLPGVLLLEPVPLGSVEFDDVARLGPDEIRLEPRDPLVDERSRDAGRVEHLQRVGLSVRAAALERQMGQPQGRRRTPATPRRPGLAPTASSSASVSTSPRRRASRRSFVRARGSRWIHRSMTVRPTRRQAQALQVGDVVGHRSGVGDDQAVAAQEAARARPRHGDEPGRIRSQCPTRRPRWRGSGTCSASSAWRPSSAVVDSGRRCP